MIGNSPVHEQLSESLQHVLWAGPGGPLPLTLALAHFPEDFEA